MICSWVVLQLDQHGLEGGTVGLAAEQARMGAVAPSALQLHHQRCRTTQDASDALLLSTLWGCQLNCRPSHPVLSYWPPVCWPLSCTAGWHQGRPPTQVAAEHCGVPTQPEPGRA
jgi:hypothetical protein